MKKQKEIYTAEKKDGRYENFYEMQFLRYPYVYNNDDFMFLDQDRELMEG